MIIYNTTENKNYIMRNACVRHQGELMIVTRERDCAIYAQVHLSTVYAV